MRYQHIPKSLFEAEEKNAEGEEAASAEWGIVPGQSQSKL